MKKLTKVIMLLLTIFCSFSCQNLNEQITAAKRYENIGKLHNQGLDFILNDLSNNSSNKLTARIDGKYTLKEFLVANQKSGLLFTGQQVPNLTNAQKQSLNDAFSKVTKHFDTFLDKELAKHKDGGRISLDVYALASIQEDMMAEASLYLSTNQFSLISQIQSAANNSYDFNSLNAALNQIESAASNLPQGEQPIVFQATSIARNSFQYWEDTYPVWNQVMGQILYLDSNGQPAIARKQLTWTKVVVGTDIAGGVLAGVASGFAIVFTGGVGGLFAAGMVAGGASIASAAIGALTYNNKF